MTRKKVLAGLMCLVAAGGLSACAQEDGAYPSRKVELLVAYGAGSGNDVVARAFAESFEQITGVNVLVVNRPGAGGIVGSTEAMLKEADGYNLYFAPVAAFTSAQLLQDVEFSPQDFETVVGLSQTPFAISVKADSPITDLTQLDALGGSASYATLGVGHASQALLGMILKQQGVTGRAVPFDGSGNVIQSTVSGETDFAVTDVSTAMSRAKGGETRILAVTGDKRLEDLPDVPTVEELGLPGSEYLGSQALAVPDGMDPQRLEELTEVAEQAINSQSYQEFLEANNYELPKIEGPDWMNVYVPEEQTRLSADYAELGIEKR